MSETEDQNLIPPEDFAEAIAAFRENPDVDFMFTNAPRGARLLLGLLFYKGHFGEAADERQIQLCLADIEPELDEESIGYLLDCDIEAGTKTYLKELRERMAAGKTDSGTAGVQLKPQSAGTNAGHVDYNFEAIKRRLADKEAEENLQLRKKAELKAALHKKTLVGIGIKVAAGLVLAGAALFGYMRWRSHCRQRDAELAERMRKAEAERALQREKSEAESLRRRNEQAERSKKAKLERERRNADLAKKIAEREEERKARIAENERKMREEEERREKFESVRGSFRNATVGAWADLDEKVRKEVFSSPGFFLVPGEDVGGTFYEVRSTNGVAGIFRLSKTDPDVSEDRTAMTGILRKSGALYMSADKNVYCISPHQEEGTLFPASVHGCFPAQSVLQGVWQLMVRYRINTDRLRCEVSYVSRDASGNAVRVRIGNVELQETLGRKEIVKAVVSESMKQYRRPVRKNVKKKRSTVVFYDGELLKRGINGITYVPRNPRGRVRNSDEYWKFREEAERQEAELESAERDAELESRHAETEYRERLSDKIDESLDGKCLSVRLVSVR